MGVCVCVCVCVFVCCVYVEAIMNAYMYTCVQVAKISVIYSGIFRSYSGIFSYTENPV